MGGCPDGRDVQEPNWLHRASRIPGWDGDADCLEELSTTTSGTLSHMNHAMLIHGSQVNGHPGPKTQPGRRPSRGRRPNYTMFLYHTHTKKSSQQPRPF